MNKKVAELREEIRKATKEAEALIEKNKGKATPESDAKRIDELLTEAKAKQDEVDRLLETERFEVESTKTIGSLNDWLSKPMPKVPHDTFSESETKSLEIEAKDALDPVVGYLTLGQAFVLSKTYRIGQQKKFAGPAEFPAKLQVTEDGRHVAVRQSEVKLINEAIRETKDMTDAEIGAMIVPMRLTEAIGDLKRPLRIRNLLTVSPSTSSRVQYVETTFTHLATEVGRGKPKPKSDMAAVLKTATAKLIAHYVRVSNQTLRDIGQLSTKIDTELVYGLDLREDYQLLWGDGTGDNLTGILNTTGIQDYDTAIGSVRGASDDTIVDKIRRAITNVSLEYLPADGVVMHPIDWEMCELLKGTDDKYIWATVSQGAEPRIWRLPVVESVSCANPDNSGERHCIVGAFKLAAALFDVAGATVEVGYAGDDFVENMKRIRAEKEIIFPIYYPQGFIDITTEAGGP